MNELVRKVEQNHFGLYVPWKLLNRCCWVPDDARSMGIHIQAGKGSGKSRLMGRGIAWQDFIRGVPLVIFDPHGATIDNFLDKITRMPREIQERLWERVVYVNMSGLSGRVICFPLYYRMGTESLYDISQRFLDVLRKLDPYLQTASVEGWNPLWRTGTHIGMILAALNFQITEAEKLLQNPSIVARRARELLAAYPDAEPAVAYIRELIAAKDNTRARRTESFFNKIAIFKLDPSMQAMFGASTPGINWTEVMSQGLAVLLDIRDEFDIERRKFKMMWAFNIFLDFVKRRGAGRHQPISLIIDELSSLFSADALSGAVFGKELDELINVLARNYRVWLTIAHQEQFQLMGQMSKTIMTMGTQIFGSTSDWEAALISAKQFYEYDPYRVKKTEPIGTSIFEDRTVEFTIDEQSLLHSYKFMRLRRYQFLVRRASEEGSIDRYLYPISIERLDQGQYPNEELVRQARTRLMQHRGKPINSALSEIQTRLKESIALSKPSARALAQATSENDPSPLWTNE
jgi:hypothetical protein